MADVVRGDITPDTNETARAVVTAMLNDDMSTARELLADQLDGVAASACATLVAVLHVVSDDPHAQWAGFCAALAERDDDSGW